MRKGGREEGYVNAQREEKKRNEVLELKSPLEATEGLGSFENSPEFMTLALSAPVSAKRT